MTRICDDCGGDMFPYAQYLFHRIEEGYVCTLCGSEVPVKIQKRARTKYAWVTVYVENVKSLSADSYQPIAKDRLDKAPMPAGPKVTMCDGEEINL